MWKRWKRTISIVTRMSAAEWWLAINILWLLTLFRVALMQRPFPDVLFEASRRAVGAGRSVVSHLMPRHSPGVCPRKGGRYTEGFGQSSNAEIGLWVERVSRVAPGRYTCLAKALTGYVLYSRAGWRPVIRVGVTVHKGNRFVAHAWLEVDGSITIGGGLDLSRYSVFEAKEGLIR